MVLDFSLALVLILTGVHTNDPRTTRTLPAHHPHTTHRRPRLSPQAYKSEFGEGPPDAVWRPEVAKAQAAAAAATGSNHATGSMFMSGANGTAPGVTGALPNCCSFLCVKPECAGCVGCSATWCGYDADGSVAGPKHGKRVSTAIAPDQVRDCLHLIKHYQNSA